MNDTINYDTISNAQNKLEVLMRREISILRELLGNMQEEQNALVSNDVEGLKNIMDTRHPLMDLMLQVRQQRLDVFNILAELRDIPIASFEHSSAGLESSLLWDCIGDECCEIISLKEQIIALLEKIQIQSNQNNYLIENRIALTKKIVEQLQHNDKNTTYNPNGVRGKKQKNYTTITLINREG